MPSNTTKQHSLSATEERALDDLAKRNKFWGSVRAAYADYSGLTQRQYELFHEQLARDAWREGAPTVDGVAVRNRFVTAGGKPRCAMRTKPACRGEATMAIGQFGYCATHAESAQSDYERWLRAKKSEHDGDESAQDRA